MGRKVTKLDETAVFQKHFQYMKSVIPKLVEAERIVDEINGSEQWTRNLNYFTVLYNRGKLACRPTKENGYTIRLSKSIQLDDIADILTPEQWEVIKSRMEETMDLGI